VANLPNVLSALRFGLVPLLLALAWNGCARFFLGCLVLSLLTDIADGLLARRFNACSELGAKLDSWADFLTYAVLPFCGWWLRPDVLRAEAGWIALAIFFYLAAIIIGLLKFKRLISYHTWGVKLSAIVFGAAVVVFFAGGPGWVFRVAAPVAVLAELEEIAITFMLPEWRTNVRSFREARTHVRK